MSDIILSDVRVLIPKTPILGATIQSDRIEHKAGANRVIVEFLPRWIFHTHVESKTPAPTAGGTWFSPSITIERHVSFSVSVGGRPRFTSETQTFQENRTVGYIGQDNAIIDHEDTFLPKPMMPEGVDGPQPFRGYLHGFNLGDGSGVVEAVRAGPLRLTLKTLLDALSHTTGTLTLVNDAFDGEYRVTVWGT